MTVELKIAQGVRFFTPETSRTGGSTGMGPYAAIVSAVRPGGRADLFIIPPGKTGYPELNVPAKADADSPRYWDEA